MEYIIYCDESSARGIKYSDFFGGCIVEAGKIHAIEDALNGKKEELNLHGEIKWTKVTEPYLDKYCAMISTFFSFVRNGDVKVRIMFRKTANQYKQADMPVKDSVAEWPESWYTHRHRNQRNVRGCACRCGRVWR